jgi:ATP-dependent Clp protease ATP-binding subunit ClpC
MELTLPVYVEIRKQGGQPIHHCRPLFFGAPVARDPHLGLAMSKLGRELKPRLDALGKDANHDALIAWTFSPPLETHILKLQFDLKDRLARTRLLFVLFPSLDRRIAFSPTLPDQWFEVMPGENLRDRAGEVVAHHFRDQEKRLRRKRGEEISPEDIALSGQAWVTTIDLQVDTQQTSTKKMERKLSALFDDARLSGAAELSSVGRCLNWLYPNELHRAVERNDEVARLFRLLEATDNRPVVLVGPRLSGKTTVLHEVVRRRVELRGKPFAARNNVWLLSPQRLISGMMYVGQWEGRVEAILKEARKRRHVLYFDDFLGLYHAGISRDAQLSVADMLKPYILRREVRVLAEMTPEAFQAFQERDRGLADQFHVLRIEAMGEEATRRVMLGVHRELEAEHHAKFDLSALPAIMQLHRSYLRDAAFPGKAAAFSRQLARKQARQWITRDTVFSEFHQKTGLSMALLDDRRKLERREVVERLRQKVVSQDEAVEAAADVVSVAKARLAAPDRPLATLLFLGPTGVGKTQCARALAEAMFSDPGRLLRFDMNEYVTPHAAAQLAGTFDEPDGLLTSAVRRQPFSVVLLDEIEKAHPDVFDLLLQVTGEGRLTDALGRTSDFSNTVVVMTSNLGTTASNQQLGLGPAQATRRQSFIKAAENFFRPEFVNRIDRIIPFDPLSREEMRKIAEMVLADVFQRDGLVRRRCALAVEPDAMQRIVDAGYHPHFGARALKRAIERQLVQPVAASLAGVAPELPSVISIYPHVDGVRAIVHPLQSAALSDQPFFAELEPAEQLARAEQFLQRADDEVEGLRGTSSGGRGVSPEQVYYYSLKEQLHQFGQLLKAARHTLASQRAAQVKPSIAPRQGAYRSRITSAAHRNVPERRFLREMQAADDIHDYLREQTADVPKPGALVEQLTQLRHEAALLHSMFSSADLPQRVLLLVREIIQPVRECGWTLSCHLGGLFRSELSFDVRRLEPYRPQLPVAFEISGPGIWPLAAAESGVHLWCKFHENLVPVSVWAAPRNEQSAEEQFAAIVAERKQWMDELAAGKAVEAGDPWPLGRIVRIHDEQGPTIDFRSGVTLPKLPTHAERKALLLAGLPLPPEMEV